MMMTADKAQACFSPAVAVLKRRKIDAALETFTGGFTGPLHALPATPLCQLPDYPEYGPQWQTWIELQVLLREASEAVGH